MEQREEMLRLVAEFEQSGQSQRAFSQAAGISLAKFGYWIRKVRKEKETSDGFLKVDTHLPAQLAGQVELIYTSGVRIVVPGQDLKLISQLLHL